MEISSINNKSNNNLNSFQTTLKPPVESRIYESCIKSSCCSSDCCLLALFKSVGRFFAYPFVKLYELIAGCFRKKTDQVEESSEESETKESQEGPKTEEAESLPPPGAEEKFTKEYFYECGKKGITKYADLARHEKNMSMYRLARSALSNAEFMREWNLGIAYHCGMKRKKLPDELVSDSNKEQFFLEYCRGKYENPVPDEEQQFSEEFFYNLGLNGFETFEQIQNFISDDLEKNEAIFVLGIRQECLYAWRRGLSFFLGRNAENFPSEWEEIAMYKTAYEEGKQAAAQQ